MLVSQKRDIIENQANAIKEYIEFKRKFFKYNMRKELREEVDEAYTLSYSLFNRNKNKMPLEKIKELIKNSLRDLRFNNGRGYFFIVSKKGERILYPLAPSKEGENIINLQDAKGDYIIKGFIKLINRRAEGFYTYVRPHPIYKDRFYTKISFLKLFEPFDWIIGAGDYIENFRKNLQYTVIKRLSEIKLSENIGFAIIKKDKILFKTKNFNFNPLSVTKNTITCEKGFGKCMTQIFYTALIPEWNWKIITYFNKSDVEKEISELTFRLNKIFYKILTILFMAVLLLLFFIFFVSQRFSHIILDEINTFKDFFHKLPENFIKIDENSFSIKEFSELAKDANEMSSLLKKFELSKDYFIEKITREKNYNQFIIENIGIALIILNREKKVEFANKTALDLLNCSIDDIQQIDIHNIIHPQDKFGNFIDEHKCPVCGVYKTKEKYFSNNTTITDVNGKEFPVTILAAPSVVNGKIDKIIINFRDISVDIRKEFELFKFKRAIEQSPVSIVITDTNATIEYVNPFFCQITGYTYEEAIGNNPKILRTKHNFDLYEELWRTIKSGKIWQGEFLNKKKDGSFYWEKAIISPVFDEKKEIINYVAVKQDITELKNIYDELVRAKEKAEAANIAKSAFLANMSHEIRTPMNAIIGFVELVLETDINETQKKYLDLVKSSSENLLRILNDILDLSKLESGKMEYNNSPFNLKYLLERQTSLFNKKAKEKGLKLRCSIDENVPESLIGDEVRIYQIITNLLSNAIKFTEKGEVNIRVKLESKKGNKCKLKFSVHDTGVGIPKDKLKSIFSPFIQADSSVTKQFGGTGLGLTITSKIIKAYNGEIWVESEEGKGSSFYFTMELEVAESEVRKAEHDSNENLIFKNAAVLVAEDNITNQILIQEILKQFNIKPVVVNNGLEALKALAEKEFDMVLMDWHMPEMDGGEAIKILRDIEKNRKITDRRIDYETITKLKNRKFTVIALTAAAMVHEKNSLLDLGFDEYLSKPIKRKILAKMLKKYLSGKFEIADEKADVEKFDKIINPNYSYLKELVGDNEDTIKNLMNSFKTTLKESIETMSSALNNNDFENISFAAHTLKGAAATIGLDNIAEVAQTIEIAAKEEEKERIELEIDYLKMIKIEDI